jgi:hypothetical protein
MSSLDDYLPERAVSFFSRDFFFLGQTKIFFLCLLLALGSDKRQIFSAIERETASRNLSQ